MKWSITVSKFISFGLDTTDIVTVRARRKILLTVAHSVDFHRSLPTINRSFAVLKATTKSEFRSFVTRVRKTSSLASLQTCQSVDFSGGSRSTCFEAELSSTLIIRIPVESRETPILSFLHQWKRFLFPRCRYQLHVNIFPLTDLVCCDTSISYRLREHCMPVLHL